jgi:spore coat protein U-like protein
MNLKLQPARPWHRSQLLNRGLALALSLFSLPAAAATWTCSVSAIGPNFGVYNPFAATPDEENGTVNVSCTLLSGGAATVTITDSFSTGSSGNYANRTLLSGANVLNYNMYYDAGYTEIRGNGTGGSQTGGATINLSSANPTQTATGTIYGKINAGQNVAPGTYTDTIVVTITF